MTLILTSKLDFYDKNAINYLKLLDDTNLILSNIKRKLIKNESAIVIANNPSDFENNDSRACAFFESLEKAGIVFKNKILLDNRNKENAKSIIQSADLIFLTGGSVLSGKEFFETINLATLLKNYKGVILGASAGSMLLCKNVCNFPEIMIDTFDASFIEGLGIVNDILFIPHFDGNTCTYQGKVERDILNDYIFPFSYKSEMIGVPNGSYILIDENEKKFYGDIFSIKNSKVKKIKIKN